MTLDVSEVATSRQLHETLAEQLGFPDYYGHNWDAFWDVLHDVEMPRHLVFSGWGALKERLPRDAALLRECLDDFCARSPGALLVEYR